MIGLVFHNGEHHHPYQGKLDNAHDAVKLAQSIIRDDATPWTNAHVYNDDQLWAEVYIHPNGRIVSLIGFP